MATSTLTIEIDDNLKEKGEVFFGKFGLDISEAFSLFISKSLEENKLPFKLNEESDLDGPYTEEEEAHFYRPSNVAAILEAKKSLEEGKGIEMTMDEFRAMSKRIREENT